MATDCIAQLSVKLDKRGVAKFDAEYASLPRPASGPNSTSTDVGVFTSVLNFSLPFDG